MNIVFIFPIQLFFSLSLFLLPHPVDASVLLSFSSFFPLFVMRVNPAKIVRILRCRSKEKFSDLAVFVMTGRFFLLLSYFLFFFADKCILASTRSATHDSCGKEMQM